MLNMTYIKHKFYQTIVFNFLLLSSFTIVSPSLAANLNFSTWGKSGDVKNFPNQTKLTNAFADGSDDANNYNVSSTDPTYISDLETFLAINSGELGVDATEGSAIKTALNALAGDVFSFDYSFSTYDNVSSDHAFATIGNTVIPLTGSSTFSYTFTTSGIYNIGIGVIDVDDTFGSSILSLTNASLTTANPQPVPEPLTILGSILAGGFGIALKKKHIKEV